ncbi:MAG: D-tyrosyl-tRNA(Tyr) deacylase [Deltaproteobacteria bacterium RIFOXYD12_FULL_50_9]|nr:MAG: D-tyrosyl-tRNA(Tyr) deacylase [Deltaproteobacteria bacterium RIFOXYD12_FULL_50_9]
MRAVVQRVKNASVTVQGRSVGKIEKGLLVFLGISRQDTRQDVLSLAARIAHLRIFADDRDLMNLSVLEIGGAILVVSQFTLYGDCRKGRRPSYADAAAPELAKILYEDFIQAIKAFNIPVASGEFQAMMEVTLSNDGPVTLLLDSKKIF